MADRPDRPAKMFMSLSHIGGRGAGQSPLPDARINISLDKLDHTPVSLSGSQVPPLIAHPP